MNLTRTTLYVAVVTAALGIAACSSSSIPSASGTLTSVGRITGFGSVFVGGVEYETGQTSVTKDGLIAVNGDSDLKVGMIVTIKGNANGTQGVAASIEFNDELEGVVQSNTLAPTGGSLMVMGQTVTVDANTNFESIDPTITLMSDIPQGAIVEISGYPDGNGSVLASFIEIKAMDMSSYSDEMEVKGVVKNLSQTVDALTFDLGGVTVDASVIAATIDLGVPLANGLYVEVKSQTGFDATSGFLVVSKMELEDGGSNSMKGKSGEDMEVEGVITAIDVANSTIQINGASIIIPDTVDLSLFVVGELVEAKLSIDVDGNAVMRNMEKEDAYDDENDFSIKSTIDSIDPANATITVNGNVIKVDKFKAIMIDHSDNPDKYFSISTLAVGDFVEAEVFIDKDGNYIAVKVQRENPPVPI